MLTLWKLGLMLLGSLALILTIGFMVNSVMRPANNAIWNARVNSRCSKLEGDERKTITVVMPCFGETAISETMQHVSVTFKNAFCALRVKFIIVAFGEDARRMTDITQEIGRTMLFKGASDFSVTDRITTVYGGVQLRNSWYALAKATPMAGDADFVVLTNPTVRVTKNWDKVLLKELADSPSGGKQCALTVKHHRLGMMNPTFPLIAYDDADTDRLPIVQWMEYAFQPKTFNASKVASSDLFVISNDFLKSDKGVSLLNVVGNERLAYPPSFFGMLVAAMLWQGNIEVYSPRKLFTESVGSIGVEEYQAFVRHVGSEGNKFNKRSVKTILKALSSMNGKAYSKYFQMNLKERRNTLTEIMGVLPSSSNADFTFRYGSVDSYNAQRISALEILRKEK